jgi:cytoskeleton protein RodZ
MESVGEFFRQVRETKGLTIDEVASKTRIRTDFVKALEDGNFAKLPDQVFARGFVRSYARSLGLDEEDAIHRFIQSAGSFYEKQDERERLKTRQVEEDRKRQANRKTVAIAIGVAVLTLIFLLSREQSAVLRHGAPEQASAAKQTAQAGKSLPEPSVRGTDHATETPKPATDPSTRQESTPSAVAVSKIEPGVASTVSTVSSGSDGPLAGLSLTAIGEQPDGPLVLDLEATELSWVVVQIDNGSPQESLLRPGEKSHWTGQEQFILTLGNAGGVKAELNGKPQKPFGPSGKVARDIVLKR